MYATWRWYGPNDPIKIDEVKATGAKGVVTALHHIPNGDTWSREAIRQRQSELGGLPWSVVESVPVHEGIKQNTSGLPALIGNYQHLGLFDGQNLAILSPKRAMRRHDDALGISRERTTTKADPLMERDIAYYQGASHDFTHNLLSWQPDHSAAVAVKP